MNEKQAKLESILNAAPLSVQNGACCFVEKDAIPSCSSGEGLFAAIQDRIKSHRKLYYFIVDVLGPVKFTSKCNRLIKKLLARHSSAEVIVNYGSGPQVYSGRTDVINVDVFAFDEVDVIPGTALPFKDESVDLFLNIAVLEHMDNPEIALSEMYRCLKPGGELLLGTPFVQPMHSAPHDYTRWTANGLKAILKDYEVLETGLITGPTSGFLWVFQEWISIALSFGSVVMADLIRILVILLTFPLKYLDILLEHYPNAERNAGGFYIYARKKK